MTRHGPAPAQQAAPRARPAPVPPRHARSPSCRQLLRGSLALLCIACGEPQPQPAPAPVDAATADTAAGYEWAVDTLDLPRLRAYGWGRDTLWGIARGRVARSDLTAVDLLGHTAWGVFVQTGSNVVSWTNEQGLFLLDGGPARLVLRAADAPPPDYSGPEVAWGPGRHALLTWIAEAGPLQTLLDVDGTHRPLRARLPAGHHAGEPAVWLDSRTVVLTAVAMASPRTDGPGEYRENGFRANLALLDIERDSIRLVTDVPDGTFLHPEGLLGEGALLVAARDSGGRDTRLLLYDTQRWQARAFDDGAARARPCAGHVVLLRRASDPSAGGEPRWDVVLRDARGDVLPLGEFQGHDVRVLWDAGCRRFVVAQESELRGLLTVLVRELRHHTAADVPPR